MNTLFSPEYRELFTRSESKFRGVTLRSSLANPVLPSSLDGYSPDCCES